MIKAIVFDFFGVICSDDYWKFVKSDIKISDKFSELANSVNLGKMSWENFLEKVAIETGKTTEEVKKMYETEEINPELVTYIDGLHKKYKTALLTNAHVDFMEPLIVKAGLDRVFDEIVISSKIGIVKPDPRIYVYTINKLGVTPEEAIFIDDSLIRVEGAKTTGMQAIQYKNFEQMKTELEKVLQNS